MLMLADRAQRALVAAGAQGEKRRRRELQDPTTNGWRETKGRREQPTEYRTVVVALSFCFVSFASTPLNLLSNGY